MVNVIIQSNKTGDIIMGVAVPKEDKTGIYKQWYLAKNMFDVIDGGFKFKAFGETDIITSVELYPEFVKVTLNRGIKL